ncbi:MAG: carbonic anhydrase [Candidatus Riflebacteria bacterium]|nr:carbonic anhydrase [Candidatus Riflebacteria bacterium]
MVKSSGKLESIALALFVTMFFSPVNNAFSLESAKNNQTHAATHDTSHAASNAASHESSHKTATTAAHGGSHAATHGASSSSHEVSGLSPEESLEKLLAGYRRFQTDTASQKDLKKAISETANSQSPFAAIVTCSDSRVPPELIFDANIGELFIVRVAGNVSEPYSVGSVEYAVEHLGTRLVVVLGHSKCGAVSAALSKLREGNITYLVHKIEPGIKDIIKNQAQIQDKVTVASKQNMKYQIMKLIESSSAIEEKYKSGKIKIIGMYYDVAQGIMTIENH